MNKKTLKTMSTDPFFNPKREFIKALWKVIVILFVMTIFVVFSSSCRTKNTLVSSSDSIRIEYRERVVDIHDTVVVHSTDSVRVTVSSSKGGLYERHTLYDPSTGNKIEESVSASLIEQMDKIREAISLLSSQYGSVSELHEDTISQVRQSEVVTTKAEKTSDYLDIILACIFIFVLTIVLILVFKKSG